MNPLAHTYLPYSQRKIQFHQELLIFFWKFCEHNKKFLFFVLKSSDVLDILTPILHHLNEARADQSRVGLVHIGVFILLLLSGERNFGVRLNKPYTATVPIDIPVFTGTHADLLILVFHKVWFHELIAAMDFTYGSFFVSGRLIWASINPQLIKTNFKVEWVASTRAEKRRWEKG